VAHSCSYYGVHVRTTQRSVSRFLGQKGIVVGLLFLAGCDGSKGVSDSSLVWCVEPDEPGVVATKDGYVTRVTPEYAREYPDLHMTKRECDAVP